MRCHELRDWIPDYLAGSDLLKGTVDRLGELSDHSDPRIRGDAAHYLGLTESDKATAYLEHLADDPDTDVRAVARESLDLLKA